MPSSSDEDEEDAANEGDVDPELSDMDVDLAEDDPIPEEPAMVIDPDDVEVNTNYASMTINYYLF